MQRSSSDAGAQQLQGATPAGGGKLEGRRYQEKRRRKQSKRQRSTKQPSGPRGDARLRFLPGRRRRTPLGIRKALPSPNGDGGRAGADRGQPATLSPGRKRPRLSTLSRASKGMLDKALYCQRASYTPRVWGSDCCLTRRLAPAGVNPCSAGSLEFDCDFPSPPKPLVVCTEPRRSKVSLVGTL